MVPESSRPSSPTRFGRSGAAHFLRALVLVVSCALVGSALSSDWRAFWFWPWADAQPEVLILGSCLGYIVLLFVAARAGAL